MAGAGLLLGRVYAVAGIESFGRHLTLHAGEVGDVHPKLVEKVGKLSPTVTLKYSTRSYPRACRPKP